MHAYDSSAVDGGVKRVGGLAGYWPKSSLSERLGPKAVSGHMKAG